MGQKGRMKPRIRRRLNRRHPSSLRSRRSSNWAPILSIAGVVLSIAAFACLIIFLIIPMLSGKMFKEEKKPAVTIKAPVKDPNEVIDLTGLAEEAVLIQKSINVPYINGNEMIYTTGEQSLLNPPIKSVCIFNLDEKKTQNLKGISCKYKSLFEPRVNENWVVFLDVDTNGVGRILGYDRKKSSMFVIREYCFGMPKLNLEGDYLAWMQQTGAVTDKIYICYLPVNETVMLKAFSDMVTTVSPVSFCGTELIWTEKAGEAEDTESVKCRIMRMPLIDGKLSEPVAFDPGMYVFGPMTNGTSIVFLDSPRGPDSKLMISVNGQTPKQIEKGVLNYSLGNDFVAYSKDGDIFIYFIGTGKKGRLTGKNSRGELSTVNKNMVCWYDITDGALVRDIIKYAKITAASEKQTVLPGMEQSTAPSAEPAGGQTGEHSGQTGGAA